MLDTILLDRIDRCFGAIYGIYGDPERGSDACANNILLGLVLRFLWFFFRNYAKEVLVKST
jgi:hypothetical protein